LQIDFGSERDLRALDWDGLNSNREHYPTGTSLQLFYHVHVCSRVLPNYLCKVPWKMCTRMHTTLHACTRAHPCSSQIYRLRAGTKLHHLRTVLVPVIPWTVVNTAHPMHCTSATYLLNLIPLEAPDFRHKVSWTFVYIFFTVLYISNHTWLMRKRVHDI